MLLWTTAKPQSVRIEKVRTEIVCRPLPKVRRVLREIRKVSRASEHDVAASAEKRDSCTRRNDEERYIVKLILMMLLILGLPAVLMLLYIVFNPEAFQ